MNAILEQPSPPDVDPIEPPLFGQNGHKRNGNIAKLPKATRDRINSWLDDGHSYPQIIKDLGEEGKDLKPTHFTQWFQGGYQDYLRHQDWRAELRAVRESGSELTELNDGHQFQEILIQLGLTEIFRVLKSGALKPDSMNFIRLFNALARLNREALGLRKYNDLRADKAAAQLPTSATKPSAEEARDTMFHAFEHALGLKAAPGPIGPDLNVYMAEAQAAAAAGSAGIPAGEPATCDIQPSMCPSVEPATCNVQRVTSSPPATRHPVLRSASDRGGSPLPAERCHECRALLPPLLATGERPTSHCNKCGTGLRPPGSLIEYCPKCRGALPELDYNGNRPSPECFRCGKHLPPAAH